MAVQAEGSNYFGTKVFPINISKIYYQEGISHPHDLTKIMHYHDFNEIVVILKGKGIHQVEDQQYPVSAGDVFVLQDYQKHQFIDASEVEIVNVMYDLKKNLDMLNLNQIKKISGYNALFILEPQYRNTQQFKNRLQLNRSDLAKVEFILNSMFWEQMNQESGYETILRNHLEDLIIFMARQYSKIETHEARALMRIGEVIDFLESNYRSRIYLDEMAERACMSKRNFHRTFRNATGETPNNYLIQVRLQKARELLRNTFLSVSDVAYEVGFADVNHFIKKFKKHLQVTPHKYRMNFY
jgi:AraC-like DNA-binding protein/mannose-6-phosphate isomerase-like protein (cupin superfamily)